MLMIGIVLEGSGSQRSTTEFEVAGLRYTCTISRFPGGSISELFLGNHKSNSQADTNARDSAIVSSFAVQHGADPEAIRRALCREWPRVRSARASARHHRRVGRAGDGAGSERT